MVFCLVLFAHYILIPIAIFGIAISIYISGKCFLLVYRGSKQQECNECYFDYVDRDFVPNEVVSLTMQPQGPGYFLFSPYHMFYMLMVAIL